ncbi:DUF29 domain-containing protein [uncultured Methylobacterium sp.]|uniref:DUF29 domain-containing protein n=1 Tax=uncultured Methylobacterium sp. TaxID=157278 RepID=UPI0035C97C39
MTSATKSALRSVPADVAYAEDFYTWTQEQGARLRAGDLMALDLENLAEEIESLGRSQFDSLVSAWRILLLHMLKFDHQPSRRTRSWTLSIMEQRKQSGFILKDNPGLKSRLDEALERAYDVARVGASRETRIALGRFPEACPYTRDEMLTRSFAIDPDDTTA